MSVAPSVDPHTNTNPGTYTVREARADEFAAIGALTVRSFDSGGHGNERWRESRRAAELDVAARRLHLDVPPEELARRRAAWQPRPARFTRGYGRLFLDEITQANEGCDFRFLHPDGLPTPEPDIF